MINFEILKRGLKKTQDGLQEAASAFLPSKSNNQEEQLSKSIELINEQELKSKERQINDDLKIPQKKSNFKTLILAIYPDKNLNLFQETTTPLSLLVCEKLYESTQYLCIEEDLFFRSRLNNIKDFVVPKGKESDDDIHLIKLHLQDNDERFNPRINQIDRIRAFRNLSKLASDFQVSPRLTLEAGQLFNLYHR